MNTKLVLTPAIAFVDPSVMTHSCAVPFLIAIAEFQSDPVIQLYWSLPVLNEFFARKNGTSKAQRMWQELNTFKDAMAWNASGKPVASAPIHQHVADATVASGAGFLLTEEAQRYAGLTVGGQIMDCEAFLLMILQSQHRGAVKSAIVKNPPLLYALRCGLDMPRFWRELIVA